MHIASLARLTKKSTICMHSQAARQAGQCWPGEASQNLLLTQLMADRAHQRAQHGPRAAHHRRRRSVGRWELLDRVAASPSQRQPGRAAVPGRRKSERGRLGTGGGAAAVRACGGDVFRHGVSLASLGAHPWPVYMRPTGLGWIATQGKQRGGSSAKLT